MKKLLLILSLTTLPLITHAQWTQVASNTEEKLRDIFFIDSLNGYCIGGNNPLTTTEVEGLVLKTTNGGNHWNIIMQESNTFFKSIVAYGSEVHAFASLSGDSSLVYSSFNDGLDWVLDTVPYIPSEVKVYNNEIYFIDYYSHTLMKTTFVNLQTIANDIRMYDINNTGLITFGFNSFAINKSSDMGLNWVTLDAPNTLGMNNLTEPVIKMIDDTIIIRASYPASLFYTTNSGVDWGFNLSPALTVFISDDLSVYGMDFSERITITNDFGESWAVQDSIGVNMNKILFYNSNLGFICGDEGTIYKTTNGGYPIGIEEGNREINNIYPNPSSNQLTIECKENGVLNIYNLNGEIVFAQEKQTNRVVLDIEDLHSGIYFVQLNDTYSQFIKE